MTTEKDLLEYAQEKYESRGHDPEDKPIFSILLFEHPDKMHMIVNKDGEEEPSGFPDTGDQYEVGFYYDLKTAIEVLNSNVCDIQEGCYNAAFILCKFQGLYIGCNMHERMYFVWDPVCRGFFQQEEPKIFKHIAY